MIAIYCISACDQLLTNIKRISGESCDPVPVPLLHCFVRHQFQNRTRLIEIIDLFG